ncbi:MAG: hypothetical protein DI539_13225 [Flavobacterium psychrophilum]|nr:MAG: hypothetical protein DI539_13225 [Flavobacterium psychrophilum]
MQPKAKPFIFLLALIGCVTVVWGTTAFTGASKSVTKAVTPVADPKPASKTILYDSLRLDTLKLSREAFLCAMQGYSSLQQSGELRNSRYLTIADFSLPSSQKRLFIIDMKTGKLIYNTYVSHGRNSGTDMATHFSNRPESNQSSLGFYVTGDTYRGSNGYSMKLTGMEEGINDNAFIRNIVMHGSAYVSEKVIAMKGYVGRSLGCPAIPAVLTKAIINTIKNGSCMFIYGNDQRYLAQSRILMQMRTLMATDSITTDTIS